MMRRYVPGILVTVILAALITWIARNTYWDEVDVPTWPKGEAAKNPFYAVEHLARELGAHAEGRHDFGHPPASSAIIVLGAWNWDLIETRRERLESWVAAGGRLVIDHTLMGDDDELEEWTGIERVDNPAEKAEKPRGAPDSNQCEQLTMADPTADAAAATHYSFCNMDGTSHLVTSRKVTWALRDGRNRLQAVRVPIGRGSVTLLNGWPFGNTELLEADHALLFTAATGLARGQDILFLSDDRGPSLLSLLWRYGSPAVVLALVLVGLWLWRTGVRFGPLVAPTDGARRSLAEQIRGTGRFTLRFGGGRALHAAAVRAMRETAERHITHYARLPTEQRIAILASLSGADPDELAHALNFGGPRRPAELRRALALLEAVRRAILNRAILGATTSNTNAFREGSYAN
jgi:hypothetical protein